MSQNRIFQVLCCEAIVCSGIGDTAFDGQACQHDEKGMVIPFRLYMRTYIVQASGDGACAGAATLAHSVAMLNSRSKRD